MKKRVTIRAGKSGTTLHRLRPGGEETKRGYPGLYPYVFEGDIEVDVEDLEKFVQVQLLNGSPRQTAMLWTYRDPFGDLKEGDLVSVPFGYYDDPRTATVALLGRGAYDGFIKDVEARFVKELAA